jgi:hypothetical protein
MVMITKACSLVRITVAPSTAATTAAATPPSGASRNGDRCSRSDSSATV